MSHRQLRYSAIVILIGCFLTFIFIGFGTYDILFSNIGAICLMIICWNQYDERQPRLAELILCTCMITIAVAGRVLFLWAPAFKPVTAIVILAGVWLGGYNGFLCGSLAALLSDLVFGLGPWTFFQMLAWGMIGGISGGCKVQWFQSRIARWLAGILSAIFFSVWMDIYTCLSTGSFELPRFFALLITSIPFVFTYCISNVLFLEAFYPFFRKKMERIQKKYDLLG